MKNSNGIALISSLLLMALILPVAILLLSSGFSEGHISRNEIYDIKSFYIAESARESAFGYLSLTSFNLPDIYILKPWRKCQNYCMSKINFSDSNFYNGIYSFSISDEESKININTADNKILSNLFKVLNISSSPEKTAQNIISEKEKNGRFNSIVDVLHNRNVSLKDYDILKDYITVNSSDDDFLPFEDFCNLNYLKVGWEVGDNTNANCPDINKLYSNRKININESPINIFDIKLLGNRDFIFNMLKLIVKLHTLCHIDGNIGNFNSPILENIGFGPLDLEFKNNNIFPEKDDALDIVLYKILLNNRNNPFVNWLLKMMGIKSTKSSYENIVDLLDVPPITPMLSCLNKFIETLALIQSGGIKITKIRSILKNIKGCDSAVKASMGATFSECLLGWLRISEEEAKMFNLPEPKSCPTENAEKSISLDELKIISPFIIVKNNPEGVININTASYEVLYSTFKSKFSEQRTKEIVDMILSKSPRPPFTNWDKEGFKLANLQTDFSQVRNDATKVAMKKESNKLWKSNDNGGVLGFYTSNVGYPYFMDTAMLLKDEKNNDGLTTEEYKLISPYLCVRSNGYRIYADGRLLPVQEKINPENLLEKSLGSHNIFSQIDVTGGKLKIKFYKAITRNIDLIE